MAQVLPVLTAIGKASGAVGTLKSLAELFAGGKSPITVKDLTSVIQGENAQMFIGIKTTDIETITDDLRHVWLPSLVQHYDTLTPDDITPLDAKFHNILYELRIAIENVSSKLMRIGAVFKEHSKDLHTDEIASGAFGFINGYTLLFLIDFIYADLHRIQIGADTFDIPNLAEDTRAIMRHLTDGANMIHLLSDKFTGMIYVSRQAHINTYRTTRDGTRLWVDRYTPLSSTAPDLVLVQPPSKYATCTPSQSNHTQRVTDRVTSAVWDPCYEFWTGYSNIYNKMRGRAQRQGIRPYKIPTYIDSPNSAESTLRDVAMYMLPGYLSIVAPSLWDSAGSFFRSVSSPTVQSA